MAFQRHKAPAGLSGGRMDLAEDRIVRKDLELGCTHHYNASAGLHLPTLKVQYKLVLGPIQNSPLGNGT